MLSSEAQTIEIFTDLQALNSSSECEVAMLKARYQGENVTKQRSIHDKPWNA